MKDTDTQTLDKYRVSIPERTFYYISDFLNDEEAAGILGAVYALPSSKWTNLRNRRLLSLPGQLTGVKRDRLLEAPMPLFLANPIIEGLGQTGVFTNSPHQCPNHCLVNEYEQGQGIMPHEDGPAYYPVTATVSLGGHTVLDIYKKTESGERATRPSYRILQEPGSLLITTGDVYNQTLHGITEVDGDIDLNDSSIANWDLLGHPEKYQVEFAARTKRISLTYRDVLRVVKLGSTSKLLSGSSSG